MQTTGAVSAAALPLATVAGVTLSGGASVAGAKSMLTSIEARFSAAVTVKVTSLSLWNLTYGSAVNPANLRVRYDAAAKTAIWTFPSFVGGSLPDGRYQAKLDDAGITDISGRPLDGDRNGTAGGDYAFQLSRLFGDANGDGAIKPADAVAFKSAYYTSRARTGYQSRFDFNSDGIISDLDRTADEARYGTVLAELGTSATASTGPAITPTVSSATGAFVTDPQIKTITIAARRRQTDPWTNFSVKTVPAGLTMASPVLSKYGGDTTRKLAASGYFYTTKVNGKWWMVDPEGNLYFDNAVGVIGPRIFPDNSASFVAKFGEGKVGNVNWATWVRSWLRDIGYNSAGPWGTPSIQAVAGQKTNYTLLLDVMSTFAMGSGFGSLGLGHANFRNGVIPVFDPAFPGYCSTFMSNVLPQVYPGLNTRSDPYLVGYMTDNELPWSTCTIDNYFKLGATDPNRLAAQAWLTARGRSTPTAQDRVDFQTYVAETYFRITSQAIRAYDPNHIVGCRFLGGDTATPYLFKAARKYLDLVTVNYYSSMTPGHVIESAVAAADIAYVSSDMYAKGVDSGMANTSGYGYTVKTQADRGAYYQQMMLSVLGSAHGVGASWISLIDNDLSDPVPEPTNQNSNKGLMTVQYPLTQNANPYKPLTDRIRDVNLNLYPLSAYLTRASIAGTVFRDTNRDGVRQSSEPGLANWRIFVDQNKNGVFDAGEINTFTSSTGTYKLAALPAGTFRVYEVVQKGWTRTKPVGASPLGYYDVVLDTNQIVSGKDFGNYLT
ncbi:hypothetical protein [Humisphaera borealis]|uniref:SD-repeat containing protein B domain-containing protein n=1 Tax=Humisphaera borealis TaxID=2807512 RepID=A0A7M2WQ19_9BACT|nr:hypothetical protein [Humisphaera borealis]QOV87617.1 hypothetical protein IPV69_15115 [Humisphaera borealis]